MKLVGISWNPRTGATAGSCIISLFALSVVGWMEDLQAVGALATLDLAIAISGAAFPKVVKPFLSP